MSLANCFKKAGKALSQQDRDSIEANVANGMSPREAVEQVVADIDTDLELLIERIEEAGGVAIPAGEQKNGAAFTASSESGPVDPATEAAEVQSRIAQEQGITPEQAAELARDPFPDPLTGLYTDEDLIPALGRAEKSGEPMVYVEADMFNLSGVNNAMESNERANQVIKAVGEAYARAYGDNPVFRRRGARFAAIVPEGFDVDAAEAQINEEVAQIIEAAGLSEIQSKRHPGASGVYFVHGRSSIEDGKGVDPTIGEAQTLIKEQMPQEENDVNRIETFQSWSSASSGQAGRVAARIGKARERRKGDGQSESPEVKATLRPKGLNTNRLPAGRFQNPDQFYAAQQKEMFDRLGLSPEQRSIYKYAPLRDGLTQWFTDRDRASTFERLNEYVAQTGADAAYVSIDISNLGGMNDILGNATADDIFINMADIALAAAQDLGDIDVIPFRHGGDEISLMIVGADLDAVDSAMKKAAEDVQRYANAIGIQDLPHSKHIGNPSKYGSGIYVGVQDIDGTTPYSQVFDLADAAVEAGKKYGLPKVQGKMDLEKPMSRIDELMQDVVEPRSQIEAVLDEASVSAGDFVAALSAAKKASPKGASVAVFDESEYAQMDTYLFDDGKAGFAIMSDGHLTGFFKHPDSSIGSAMNQLMPLAIAAGATKLDAFDGFLTESYSRFGFEEVDAAKWSDDFAPDGWDKSQFGTPDVVYMEISDEARENILRQANEKSVSASSGLRQGISRVSGQDGKRGRRLSPLQDAPSVKGVHGPIQALVQVAEQYAADNGIDLKRQAEYVDVDIDRAERIAAAFEQMEHAPNDPAVKEAYENLIRQTLAQYEALVAAGYEFWFINMDRADNQEYVSTPWNAIRDIAQNKKMGVFPTDDGFGSSEVDVSENPLLEDVGIEWPVGEAGSTVKKRVLANDLFRAVHDAFGHGLEGSGFRARGEENAWQAHVRLFTGSAVGALTTETRGQNSWLNYGSHGDANRTASTEDTIFADQKTGLMPEWTWNEGRAADQNPLDVLFEDQESPDALYQNSVSRSELGFYSAVEKAVLEMNLPAWKPSKKNPEGAARGQDVWAKIKSSQIKKEEADWLGLEEFLTADPEAKFTRDEVAQYIRQNGVNVVEVVADQESSESELEWDDAEVWDDRQAWEYLIEDEMYRFDEGEETDWQDQWLDEHVDEVVQHYANDLPDDEFNELEELPDDEKIAWLAERFEVNSDFESRMRDDYEDVAEERAVEAYRENPIYIREASGDIELIIFGNDDQGYDIRTSMNYRDVVASDIWSEDEAFIQAEQYARENDLIVDEGDESVARWGEYIMDGYADNYREIKLTLPDIEGDFYNDVHFPDRNLLAFLRVTDRELETGIELQGDDRFQSIHKIDFRMVDNPVEGALNKRLMEVFDVDTGVVLTSLTTDGRLSEEELIQQSREKLASAEEGKRIGILETIGDGRVGIRKKKSANNTYFIDEFQSDWHQDGRQKGYVEDSVDYDAAVDEANEILEEYRDEAEDRFQELAGEFNGQLLEGPPKYEFFVDGKRTEMSAYEFGQILADLARKGFKHDYDGAVGVRYDLVVSMAESLEKTDKDWLYGIRDRMLEFDRLKKLGETGRDGVPDAPFKGDAWMSLGLKRAVIDAVENGYEAIAWPNAEVLMDRWSSRYESLYRNQYDKKMPSLIKKITKQEAKQFDESGDPILDEKEFIENMEVRYDEDNKSYIAFNKRDNATEGLFFDSEKEAKDWIKSAAKQNAKDKPNGYWIIPITDDLKARVQSEGLALFQDKRQGKSRGQFFYDAMDRAVIQLGDAADLSTLTHESYHLFLDVMTELAQESPAMAAEIEVVRGWLQRNASDLQRDAVEYAKRAGDKELAEQIAAMDLDAIRDMVGSQKLSLRALPAGGVERFVTTAALEYFARGGEAYMLEGRAPSAELGSVFRRMKQWFLQIYKTARALKVNLSDDIRSVFDRMLATEQEIAQAQEIAGYGTSLAEVDGLEWTDEEKERVAKLTGQAREQAERELMAEHMRDLNKVNRGWWEDEKDKLRKEYFEELNRNPAYQARMMFTSGKRVDGTPLPEGVEQIKLDRDALVEKFGVEFLKRLPSPKNRENPASQYVYARKDGVDPMVAARLYGFDSVTDMVEALIDTRPVTAYVESLVEAEMRARHPDINMTDESAQIAMEAVYNDKQAQVMLAELKKLESNVGAPETIPQLFRMKAQEIISTKSIKELRPDLYRNKSATYERQALREAMAGNMTEALEAKQKALLHHYLYREANKARKESDSIFEYAKRLQKKSTQERIGKAGADYLERINELLGQYEFRRVSNKELARRKSLIDWVSDKQEAGEHVDIPEAVLERAEQTNWREVSIDELMALRDSLKNLEHVARVKNRLATDAAKRELQDVVDELVVQVQKYKGKKRGKDFFEQKRIAEDLQDAVGDYAAIILNMDSILRSLDGFEDLGPLVRAIKMPIDKASREVLPAMQEEYGNKLAAIFNEHYTRDEQLDLDRKDWVKVGKRNISRAQALMMALNWGNEYNREAVLNGETSSRDRLSEMEVKQILDSLEKKDWDFAQSYWDMMDFDLWPQIKASEERRKGVAPEKVEASPVVTKHGVYRGGYHRVKFDRKLGWKVSVQDTESMARDVRMGAFSSSQTKRGFTKERQGTGGHPLDFDLSVIHSHMKEVVVDLALGDVINDVSKIINHRDFVSVMEQTGNTWALKAMNLWLKDTAAQEVLGHHKLEKFSRRIRTGFSLSVLSWNLNTILLQPSGLLQSVPDVGYKNMLRAIIHVNKAKWHGEGNIFDAVKKRSKAMHMRRDSFNKEIQLVNSALKDSVWLEKIIGTVPFVKNAKDGKGAQKAADLIKASMMGGISATQQWVDTIVWIAAYEKGKTQFESDSDARQYADNVVVRTQASAVFSDRSAIERGTISEGTMQSEFVRSWTTLASYMFAKSNLAYEKTKQTSFRDPVEVMKWTHDMFLYFISENIYRALMVYAVAMMLGGDDEENEELLKKSLSPDELAVGGMSNVAAGLPFIRNVSSAAQGFDSGDALSGFFGQVAAAGKQIVQGEIDAPLLKSLNRVGGTIFKYPSGQINRTFDTLWKDMDGEDVEAIDYLIWRKKDD